ncbi:MAG: 30S ribosomal protein S8 [Verrucomicrobiota bacterium]|jgi:small subunit ribosomal protein S8|nr:30S ribosomal protein S8 [Verrucomicrobiota bacterium]
MDPVADMLTCVRNANMALKPEVVVRHSKLKESVARVLKQEGFIADYQVSEEKLKKLQIMLKIKGRKGVIEGIKKISKPGLRHYVGAGEIPRVLGGLGVAIISTSKGVLTGQEARAQKIGGEVLAHVW